MKETYLQLLSKVAVVRKRYILAALLLGVAAFNSAGSFSDSIADIIDLLLRREITTQEKIDDIKSDDKSFLAHSSS